MQNDVLTIAVCKLLYPRMVCASPLVQWNSRFHLLQQWHDNLERLITHSGGTSRIYRRPVLTNILAAYEQVLEIQ